MQYISVALAFGLLGVVLGSFINAWVWRTRENLSIVRGRSMCPSCKHQLAWQDLIPVFSYITLGGKCRYCRKPISILYPALELATGALFAGLYLYFQPTIWQAWLQLAILLAISVLLIAAFVYDSKYMQLPEAYMLPAIALAALSLGLTAFWQGWAGLTSQLVALAVVVAVYSALWYFSGGKWLGAGDIRVVAVMGLILGPKALMVALFGAYLIGAAYGVYILRGKKQKRGIRLPFGPFLIIGFYIGIFAGNQIANWYLGLN